MSACPAGCGAQVRYVRMQSGKRNPVQPYDDERGNIVIRRGVGYQLGPAEAAKARDAGYALYLCHLAVCPKAKEQDRERRQKAAAGRAVRIVTRRGRTFGVVDGGGA